LYHDIGKLHAPMFFIENQVTGVNPHDDLSFEESAKIIIGHVRKGVERAKAVGLPEQIIDFIRTHHGTTTVQYFYRSYLRDFPEGELDKEHFSYPGPKPFTKEMAVLMMADSVEAASRSLKEYTEENIENLIGAIIDNQMKEGQFNNADITFRDITVIKGIFKKKLMNAYHVRVEYPS
jgi:putative nucleotidyltransferase with HDIG domain